MVTFDLTVAFTSPRSSEAKFPIPLTWITDCIACNSNLEANFWDKEFIWLLNAELHLLSGLLAS